MKKLFANIPNRWKAVYLIWVSIHSVLLLTGNLFKYRDDFYPFYEWGRDTTLTFRKSVYDYSEFIIYLLAPIVIYLVIRVWNKKDAKE